MKPTADCPLPFSRTAALVAALALWCVAPLSPCQAGRVAAQDAQPTFDIVIRGGRVLDGAGNPWRRMDIGIVDGRIARVGAVPGTGRTVIDAEGRYVAPGFIDMMDQSGEALMESGAARNKLRMGVTTLIAGEAGTPVPAGGIASYLRELEARGLAVNFGTYFSAAQARRAVLGFEDRAPTPGELDRMRALVDTAMANGALGLTTALIYPPGSYAGTDELVALAEVAAEHGGLYASHIRDEGPRVMEAVREALEIGARAGLPVEIFHLKVAHQPSWGRLMPRIGRLIEEARGRGVDAAADVYPYTAAGTGLEATIPAWAHEGGTDALRRRLSDSGIRARLKREIREGLPGWFNPVRSAGGWRNIVLVNARNPQNATLEGRSIAEIARATGRDPADVAFDLVQEADGRVMALFHVMSEEDIETALRFPWTSIGSDAPASIPGEEDPLGLPHPRQYGTFPRVLRRYVVEREVLSLQEAVRKMTSWPATRMGLFERGVIREGLPADIVVFDLDALRDHADYEDPEAAPEGIEWVLVNGVVVLERGRATGARPGRVLWGPGRSGAASGDP